MFEQAGRASATTTIRPHHASKTRCRAGRLGRARPALSRIRPRQRCVPALYPPAPADYCQGQAPPAARRRPVHATSFSSLGPVSPPSFGGAVAAGCWCCLAWLARLLATPTVLYPTELYFTVLRSLVPLFPSLHSVSFSPPATPTGPFDL